MEKGCQFFDFILICNIFSQAFVKVYKVWSKKSKGVEVKRWIRQINRQTNRGFYRVTYFKKLSWKKPRKFCNFWLLQCHFAHYPKYFLGNQCHSRRILLYLYSFSKSKYSTSYVLYLKVRQNTQVLYPHQPLYGRYRHWFMIQTNAACIELQILQDKMIDDATGLQSFSNMPTFSLRIKIRSAGQAASCSSVSLNLLRNPKQVQFWGPVKRYNNCYHPPPRLFLSVQLD